MYCNKCGTQNPDYSISCINCGNNLKVESIILSTSHKENRGTFEQFDIISEEIEKLGFIYKLGFYIEGFFVLLFFSLYTLFIGPIIVYFWGKRGWPRNSLVKAFLYSNVIYLIIFVMFIPVVIFSFLAFDETQMHIYDVSEAIGAKEKVSGKTIQINGNLVKGTDQWEVPNQMLTFKMTDGLSSIVVVYKGEGGEIQSTNAQVLATGKFEGSIFKAQNMFITSSPQFYPPQTSED
jgi:cytochrome c-type biogenesis protein CcmE